MYLPHPARMVPILALAFLGLTGLAAAAEADPASDPYRVQERAARAQYMTDLETARAQYGEGSAEYQDAVERAADAYHERLTAAATAPRVPGVQPDPIPFPAAEGSYPYTQQPSDWEKFKGASKEAGEAIGEGAEKAGKAVGRGAKRVGQFFKDGYEDVKSSLSD